MIAQRCLRHPSTYRETFEVLAEANIIPLELADRMADLAGFRNVLVHIYWRLDTKRVYELLQQERQTVIAFRDIVQGGNHAHYPLHRQRWGGQDQRGRSYGLALR